MQKKITNIIINDINDMLNDIGQDEFTSDKKGLTGTGAIRKELEKYVDITYNINLIKIWGAVISQYVPKIKYVVKYNPQLVDSIGIEHNSIITEIQNKLENGQNINSEKDKIWQYSHF